MMMMMMMLFIDVEDLWSLTAGIVDENQHQTYMDTERIAANAEKKV